MQTVDRSVKRRAYNAWRKFKKRLRDRTLFQLGNQFIETDFEYNFEKQWPNPMYHGKDYFTDPSLEENAKKIIELLSKDK